MNKALSRWAVECLLAYAGGGEAASSLDVVGIMNKMPPLVPARGARAAVACRVKTISVVRFCAILPGTKLPRADKEWFPRWI